MSIKYTNENEDIQRAKGFSDNPIKKDKAFFCSLGDSFMLKNEYRKAVKEYLVSLMIDKNNLCAYKGASKAYKNLKEYDKAIKHLKNARNVYGFDSEIYYELGLNYLLNADNVNAQKNFIRTIKLEPNNKNAQIGTIQNIKEISELVHRYGGILHTDATQAFGHIPIDVEELGIDMMSCSGHKISPVLRGIGFLYKRNGINIQPLIYGAQENGLRGGTEFTYGIIGLNKALELCVNDTQKTQELCVKRDYFIHRLIKEFNCKLNGHKEHRLPNNINVTFPQNITGESLLYMLDMSNIKISTGSACNSKEINPSHVLKAIKLTDQEAMKSVRFTLPEDITYEDIDKVIKELNSAIKIVETN